MYSLPRIKIMQKPLRALMIKKLSGENGPDSNEVYKKCVLELNGSIWNPGSDVEISLLICKSHQFSKF